ncbi:FAD-dependent oxidoreductase [Devosia ginsengisoli]|uniref:FAD-dependent monooxygenase n=1 Tax=Devosia ginsengisoli TaxID=400770 RepID=A0A5B8LX64_9HYPH|nr:NAD(P)/FAD-dependent oxidoreductase [Devosia ginsengisoli]QDZ12683.1 FAD-dependent monooxygenase [Devosia ginsengisoli]
MSVILPLSASPLSPSSTIAVCGGGIGGLATALALKQAGFAPMVFERQQSQQLRDEGLFLTLAPNGCNALRALGLADRVMQAGLPTRALAIFNEAGKRLTLVDYANHAATYGAGSITLRRGALAGILLDAALEAGIAIHHGAGITDIVQDADGVVLAVNGEQQRFALALACDGLRSTLRRQIFPDLPQPRYSGLIGTGGFAEAPDVPDTGGAMNMMFGRRGFFGYIKQGSGPVYWFNSYPAPESETGPVVDGAAYAGKLAALHDGDPLDTGAILAATPRIDRHYPIYDMPELPHWSSGRVLLMGDAAHAVAPHSGQGASLAIEDGVVLAACLSSAPDHASAYARFEGLRRERVHKAIALGRAVGAQKQAQSWLALRLRDLMLPLFMPMGARMQEKLYAFRADRTPLAQPVQ